VSIETVEDTRSFFDSGDFAEVVYLGANLSILGIFDSNFDDSLDVNGQRIGLRCINIDVVGVSIGASITITSTAGIYTVRAKEVGQRTTLLILELT